MRARLNGKGSVRGEPKLNSEFEAASADSVQSIEALNGESLKNANVLSIKSSRRLNLVIQVYGLKRVRCVLLSVHCAIFILGEYGNCVTMNLGV